ncbi:transcription factor EC isoform X1 [Canis lupus baileyi]|uniref:Transcription factor EC n=2 Tax=Canis lupus familiaris TaxID=9615 RepID=A0A8C0YZM2_CANLF|nr:transcription factor EC isoform X1 [Canis lupus familiaris]XP_022283330.1 transcription factor EC isoform X1 [Canis lupus familiaris]XP_022283331.1 transcription factor EC isoform X1 [Canis lupus familiaris]XP_022283332.1 transcription factor EC isoform X1 [Canis lupus familiaris]XP_022283333.1 transcription factor EC isoform X1 [Canis lupus familiaris]XP_022283335.1 transcription factor EC isoform X1 [Canis lupus familiaris]XP_022283336.1 transcription factor EC isoform X1 [Canis lupus fa|eukprot:XP_005628810.1 transcription factor EC isoform X1 [Canis lupus familiaris]
MLQALPGLQFQQKEQLGEKEKRLHLSQEARAQHTQFHMQFSYKPMFQRLFPVRPEISSSQLPSFSKVSAHLESPTKSQLQKVQRQQVKPFMTLDYQIVNQTLKRSHPPTPNSALLVQHGHQSPESDTGLTGNPLTKLLSVGKEDDNVEWHMEDVIEDIIGMESSFKEEGTDSPLLLQRTLSGSILDVYSGEQGISPVNMGLTSASCPSSLPMKREITETDTRALAKERQKKDNHNLIERRRRYNINYRIKELGTLIPKSNDPDMRWNKGTILKASVEYIKWLQKEQQRARELEHRQKKLEQANRRLLLRIQELEIQARAHGLPALASLGTVDLGAHVTKQQTHLEQNSVDYCQQLTLSQGTSPELCDQAMAFSDPLSHFTDLSFSAALKEEHRLNDMLLDDTVSPFGTDPLLSATSPAVSKESSRRSSFSSDDGDEL